MPALIFEYTMKKRILILSHSADLHADVMTALLRAKGHQPYRLNYIRLFSKMSADWFGVSARDVGGELLASLVNSIFPTTLTSLYRSTLELQAIAGELLAYQLPDETPQHRSAIIETLLFGFHSHAYALTGTNLAEMGLAVTRDRQLEHDSWAIARTLEATLGGAVRRSACDPRSDVLLATRYMTVMRFSRGNRAGLAASRR